MAYENLVNGQGVVVKTVVGSLQNATLKLQGWVAETALTAVQPAGVSLLDRISNYPNLTFFKDFSALPEGEASAALLAADYSVGAATATPLSTRGASNPSTYLDKLGRCGLITNSDSARISGGFRNQNGFTNNKGLLIEGTATNSLKRSHSFYRGDWVKSNMTVAGLKISSTGPDINSHQGYAWDGTYHYTFDTTTIYKRSDDGSWTAVATNATPFSGLDAGYNHLGDGTVYGNLLYIPGEHWVACGDTALASILIFNTSDLSRANVVDVSAYIDEIAGLTIDPVARVIYAVSYCDGSQIWKFDLDDFSYLGVITLSESITQPQGLTWDYDHEVFFVASNLGFLYQVESDGTVTTIAPNEHTLDGSSNEGLEYVGDNIIRWLYDDTTNQKVVYYDLTDWFSEFSRAPLRQGVHSTGVNGYLLTATAANATILQAVTSASSAWNFSICLRRKTGTGNVDITLDNGSTWTTVDLSSGEWVRVQSQQTLANPTFGVRIVTSGDEVYVAMAQGSITTYVPLAATSYVPTEASALTRNLETLAYPCAGNMTADEETIIVGFVPFWAGSQLLNNAFLHDSDDDLPATTADRRAGAVLASSDSPDFSVNLSDSAAVKVDFTTDPAAFTEYVYAVVCQHSSPYLIGYLNGVQEVTYTAGDYVNNVLGTSFYVGSRYSGVGQLHGLVKFIARFSKKLTAAQINEIAMIALSL